MYTNASDIAFASVQSNIIRFGLQHLAKLMRIRRLLTLQFVVVANTRSVVVVVRRVISLLAHFPALSRPQSSRIFRWKETSARQNRPSSELHRCCDEASNFSRTSQNSSSSRCRPNSRCVVIIFCSIFILFRF